MAYLRHASLLCALAVAVTGISCYTFQSPIDNLLYLSNTSTLFAIASSHLHQLHWSTTNQTLLLLHRRVQLHFSLDHTELGVSVFTYDSHRHLLLICSRSPIGRCVLYDANDITRVYILDPTTETNYLGCLVGCYTFTSSAIIRSAIPGNRFERNGNIINSQIEIKKNLYHFNIKYQFQSNDDTLVTSLTFLPDPFVYQEYIYGFDYQQYTYYLMKSSRLARLCQASIAMRMTYEEIPLLHCQTNRNSSTITGAFYSVNLFNYLYVIYGDTVCLYSMNDIHRAFQESKMQCQAGNGYRLQHIVDTNEGRPKCEKILDGFAIEENHCAWQSYPTNTYMDGLIGASGEMLYRSSTANVRVNFVFAQDDTVVIGTSAQHILKFVRHNRTSLHLLHETIYQHEAMNSQYVIDEIHQTLIFAIGTELHRYAFNSCSLYDTCRSCIGSRRHARLPCQWLHGHCSLSGNESTGDYGCPPSISQITPINASVNAGLMSLVVKGSFDNVQLSMVKVIVKFPLFHHNQYACKVKRIQNDSLICDLIIPRQPMAGVIWIDIRPNRVLTIGDTDIAGSVEYPDIFYVFVPKPTLLPAYGPMSGGTKVRILNLTMEDELEFVPSMRIFLGKQPCPIIQSDSSLDEIFCLTQACTNATELLELNVMINNHSWQIDRTFFQCQPNPMIFDWSPRKSMISGGYPLYVSGQNLNIVQSPKMRLFSYAFGLDLISGCDALSNSQMVCITPPVDKTLAVILPLDLDVSFIMDGLQLTPEDDALMIVADPVYYSFDDPVLQINSTTTIQFQGVHLASSHSLDQINVRIDNINNACIPLNLTEISLTCILSKSAVKNFRSNEPNVEIRVGSNLVFSIGQISFESLSRPSSLLVPYLSRQIGPWTILVLLILSSVSILTLVLTLIMFTRRRFSQSSQQFRQEGHPPTYYGDIWCQLGKKWQINRKDFTLAEKVGQGCFGDVYKGELKVKGKKAMEVAIKVSRDRSVSSMHDFLFEANRMKAFSHPNVLSLIGVSWDPARQAMVLLPYMKNGDLRSYISSEKNHPTVRQLITWGIQVADGMEYLASLKFVHRDLATRNCMLDEQLVCRISDFGLSRDVIDRDYYTPPVTMKGRRGKPVESKPRRLPIRWLSPESIETSRFTIQSDVWSFGVLLWELLSRGRTPYPGIDNSDIYAYVKNGYRLFQPNFCPPMLYHSVMSLCWHSNPQQRPSFTQLAHDIRHILHQLELDQQRQQTSSVDEDTTIIQRYPIDRRRKRLSTTTVSSASTIGGQYITTPHRRPEVPRVFIEHQGETDDAYAVTIHSNPNIFSTSRLLPEYTETSITEDTS